MFWKKKKYPMRTKKNTEVPSKGSRQATVYSRDASAFYRNAICMQGRPSSPQSSQARAIEPSTVGYTGTVVPSPLCQGGGNVCQPGWVPKLLCSITRELSTALSPTLSPPPIRARYSRDLGQRLPAGTPVWTNPGNIPPTHPSTSNLLGSCLDI